MQFHRQLNPHLPNAGLIGDCFRTCIACFMNLEPQDVPNFMEVGYKPDGTFKGPPKEATQTWLAERGLTLISWPIVEPDNGNIFDMLDWIGQVNGEDFVFMLTGMSVLCPHVCIYTPRGLLWDPSDAGGLKGPHQPEGVYWVKFLASLRTRYTP